MNIRYYLNRGILRLQGHKLFDYFDGYKKREYLTIEENRKIQKEKLKQILLHSYVNCPYYRKILKKPFFIPDSLIAFRTFNVISKIWISPSVSRSISVEYTTICSVPLY